MRKVLMICGPTALGKTSLAITLARKLKTEIISADSRQVYQGLDIGTGKEIDKFSVFNSQFSIRDLGVGYHLIKKIPVWLLDIVSPKRQFNVADWLSCAHLVIKKIWKENKLPIVVGGTGFYLRALVSGLDSLGTPANKRLREKLEGLSVASLQQKLKAINSKVFSQMNPSDQANPRRLIRKIEVASSKMLENSSCNRQRLKNADFLIIGLTALKEVIYQKIDQRLEKRLSQGLIDEIRRLLNEGVSWDDPGMNALAYKEFRPYFEGKESLDSVRERWFLDECHYAKRQLTWFKKEKGVFWFDITEENYQSKIAKLVNKWYSLNDKILS